MAVYQGGASIDENGRADEEAWKSVVGYEGVYEVSSLGNVRRCGRNVGGRAEYRPRRIVVSKAGYCVVHLSQNGRKEMQKVHRLVAEAFLPNPDGKPCINHKDASKRNNAVENLEWCTHLENNVHAIRNGLRGFRSDRRYGEKSYHCKLSEADVAEIKRIRGEEGFSQSKLANMFRVGQTQIGRILRGEQRTKGSVVLWPSR